MNGILALCILIGFCLLILFGFLANMFLYSSGLFRIERLRRLRNEHIWRDFWASSPSSDTDHLVQ
jgi:hypothetical protein